MSAQPQPDLLSEVLAGLKLDAAFFFHAEFSAPWTVHSPPSRHFAPHLSPRAGHLIIFHLVASGAMEARLEPGGAPVRLSAGDIVAFPHGDAHTLGNGPGLLPIETGDTLSHALAHGLEVARFGGGGETTEVVCGFLALDTRPGSPLLAGLPPMLHVHLRQDPSGQWLENSIRFSVTQAAAPGAGSRAVLSRLAETLFLDTVRRYASQSPEGLSGWLAGARDPAVGKALSLLHRRPAEPWTLAALAHECGLSRSVLASRFKACLGQSPIAYLTRWRLHLAARLLAADHSSLAEIAEASGYESEPAFHRAFKREFGIPPAQFRGRSTQSPNHASTTPAPSDA